MSTYFPRSMRFFLLIVVCHVAMCEAGTFNPVGLAVKVYQLVDYHVVQTVVENGVSLMSFYDGGTLGRRWRGVSGSSVEQPGGAAEKLSDGPVLTKRDRLHLPSAYVSRGSLLNTTHVAAVECGQYKLGTSVFGSISESVCASDGARDDVHTRPCRTVPGSTELETVNVYQALVQNGSLHLLLCHISEALDAVASTLHILPRPEGPATSIPTTVVWAKDYGPSGTPSDTYCRANVDWTWNPFAAVWGNVCSSGNSTGGGAAGVRGTYSFTSMTEVVGVILLVLCAAGARHMVTVKDPQTSTDHGRSERRGAFSPDATRSNGERCTLMSPVRDRAPIVDRGPGLPPPGPVRDILDRSFVDVPPPPSICTGPTSARVAAQLSPEQLFVELQQVKMILRTLLHHVKLDDGTERERGHFMYTVTEGRTTPSGARRAVGLRSTQCQLPIHTSTETTSISCLKAKVNEVHATYTTTGGIRSQSGQLPGVDVQSPTTANECDARLPPPRSAQVYSRRGNSLQSRYKVVL